jgi:hypothetical protein
MVQVQVSVTPSRIISGDTISLGVESMVNPPL